MKPSKIAIFDGILETHVGSSLGRALASRGHTVLNTGKIGHGFKFEEDPVRLKNLEREVDRVLDFDPDYVFVFRPASLPYQLLRRIRSKGSRLIAWFSDDPVLWRLSYGPIVDEYDVILHCGGEKVLGFYENKHGRATGINFPFWTDSQAFPYVYGANDRETDVLFLGNVHDQVRRQRYFDLSSMKPSIRIHGSVGADYYHVGGGYLDSDAEVIDAGSRCAVAVNIPQFFRDHEGLPTWFEGLGDLGFFQYPSRVIQYAAMGIPMVSVVPDSQDLDTFPEIICVDQPSALSSTIERLLRSGDLPLLSAKTRERFEANYSAEARVLALEAVLEDDGWRKRSLADRVRFFADFDGRDFAPLTGGGPHQAPVEQVQVAGGGEFDDKLLEGLKAHLETEFKARSPKNILLVGTGWANAISAIRTAERALDLLGHTVTRVNPFPERAYFSPDPMSQYRGIFDCRRFVDARGLAPDVIMFVGCDYIPDPDGARQLAAEGVKFLNHANDSSDAGYKSLRLSMHMDVTTLLNSTLVQEYKEASIGRIEHCPDLVDRSFVKMLVSIPHQKVQVGVLAERETHIGAYRMLTDDLKSLPRREFVADVNGTQANSLANIARTVRSTVVFALPDSSRKGPLPNRLLGHALIGGGIPVVKRALAPAVNLDQGTECLAVGGPGEIIKKLWRLGTNTEQLQRLRTRAQEVGLTRFAAEERIEDLIQKLFAEPRETASLVLNDDVYQETVATICCAAPERVFVDIEVDHDPAVSSHLYDLRINGRIVYLHDGFWKQANRISLSIPVVHSDEVVLTLCGQTGVRGVRKISSVRDSRFSVLDQMNVSAVSKSPFGSLIESVDIA
ncbi:hypothetical protein JTF08_06000 [Micrococcaceae bacterium RIT802]|nr:hypothetical protein [Micrococcaceae bacterium RIT 802]